MRPRSLLAILALALAAACGDPTGPLNGIWRYSTGNMTSVFSPNVMCIISDVTVNLSHRGSALAGQTSGGSVYCTSQGHMSVPTPLSFDVSGFTRDSLVSFDIGGTSGIKNVGIRVGDQVVGTASVPVDLVAGDTIWISGQFRLLR
jgi:hypothetical protein